MPPFPNLVSDSFLITETIKLLQNFGGSASVVNVVDYVMKIRKPPPELARLLIADIVDGDPRLKLTDDLVELVAGHSGELRLSETDFVVFDLETTGAKCPPCRITEIGAYRVSNGRVTHEFQTLVNPEMPIPPFITQLTGISDSMVANAPKFAEVSDGLLDFIGNSVLVAHNAHFDLRFLNHEVSRVYGNYRVVNQHLCTVQLSRRLLPEIPTHRLKTVAEHYEIRLDNHHRAADDARATAEIFVNLLGELDRRGIADIDGAKKVKLSHSGGKRSNERKTEISA
ncbi:MAG: 3'-5' exoribonuclease [Acidobacteria bacterium]|nr:3'-5' exoribonuclease [Acidobacteriota bacterium]